MFDKILSIIRKMRFIINPFVRYQSNYMGEMQGVLQQKRETPLIVSLSSTENSFKDLEISLYSLFNQITKPDRIILWLSDEYELPELPYFITKYIKNGLEIMFVKDAGEYTKIIYALKEFSDAVIVTAEDNVYYPKRWLKRLYESYVAAPSDIHLHLSKRVSMNEDKSTKELTSCENWQKVKEETAEYDNFVDSSGGVLFPPKCFSNEVFREDIFLKEVPDENIWIWFMALISGRKIRVVTNHINSFAPISLFAYLCQKRQKHLKNKNQDKQVQNLMKYYKQNIMSKLES